MRNLIIIALAVAFLAALHFTGFIASFNITHPFWNFNALVFGGLAGALIAGGIFLFARVNPTLTRVIMILVVLVFLASIAISQYYANVFINAENFDLFAADMWHRGAYVAIAGFVATIAIVMRKLLS